jgi:hypothetical protein
LLIDGNIILNKKLGQCILRIEPCGKYNNNVIQRKHKEYELIKKLNTCRISTLLAKYIACASRGKLYLFFIPAGIIGSDTSIQGAHVCHED